MIKSLRWRIQFWHGVILAIVIGLFGTITYLQQRQSRLLTIRNELTAAAEVLTGQLQAAAPATLQTMLDRSQRSESQQHFSSLASDAVDLYKDLQVPRTFAPRRYHHRFEHPYFVIWNAKGSVVKASSTAPEIPFPNSGAASFAVGDRPIFRRRQDFQEIIAAGTAGTFVVTGRHIHADMKDLRNVLYLLIGSGFGVFVLGLLGGWILSGRSVQPIAEISRVADQISEKNLTDRIEVGETDSEFADLAQTLNDAFSRLQAAFEKQQQFTADASHELRTPLSVVQMHQELALSKERTPEEYRDAIETCQRATSRMNALVESLLTLARLDTYSLKQSVNSVNIGNLVHECVVQLRPLADSRSVRVSVKVGHAVVDGDPEQLAQVVSNLLSNAIMYSPSDSVVAIAVKIIDVHVDVSVTDDGVGIAEEDLPHLFERFYRVDKQRSRDSGGSGLGLSICKSIVESHGGKILAESVIDEGSTFRIRLPVSADSSANSG